MKANTGDTIQTTIYADKNYPVGSLFRVYKCIKELNEVLVLPTWYKAGAKCFGISVFLEDEDYEVVTRAKKEQESMNIQDTMQLETGRAIHGQPIRLGDTLQGNSTHEVVVLWDKQQSKYVVQFSTEIPKFTFDLDEFLQAWSDLIITGSILIKEK